MKNNFKIIVYFFCAAILISSCDKSVDEQKFGPLEPANLDLNAGTWKTYILTSPTEIVVAAPKATNDPAYVKELDSLKNVILPALTTANRNAVAYWGVGSVLRWNEIARELAAKYNLAPASNAEGKYPVPDATNPLADPKFPFANPPYAARAFAYLSVAQYDALVSTWHYKNQFKRSAPSKVDAAIKATLPVSELPTYPSEDAVIAAASYTILIAMFPGEVPYLNTKLAEAKNARLWGGMNVSSDIAAGEALGKAVGAKVMAKARTDGMGSANNQAATAGMIEQAKVLGLKEVWLSQEAPLRPGMLPTYGNVATWNFDKATMIKNRPAPPPALDSDVFKRDLAELKSIQKNQTREQARIANLWSDGVGSYTPPGHWFRRAAIECQEAKYSEVRSARTMALMGTAVMDAGIACWDTKYYYYFPRPQQFGVKTSIGLPNFPSYLSGHSTFSSAAAVVLSYIFPNKADEFNKLAIEVSNSRVYGMIHYRFDCEIGLEHGKKIGEFAIKRGKEDGSGL